MRHTTPYQPPNVGEAQQQIAAQVFARRATGTTTVTSTGSSGYIAATTAPGSPSPGDRWFNLSLGILFTYVNDGNSSQWVEL